MFAPVIGAAYTMTTKREAHWSEQAKAQNTEKGMYVGLRQPRGDGERYVTPARAAAKETTPGPAMIRTVCKYRQILITGIISALIRFSSETP